MKRFLALLLAAVMVISFAACKGGNADVSEAGTPEAGKALPADAVLNVVTVSHSSWPYQENWEVWKCIKESVGGTVNVNAYPESDFATKFQLLMASPDSLPDVFSFQNTPTGMPGYCEQGAFLSMDDNLDKLPNYKKFWDSASEEVRKKTIDTRRYSDGKVYVSPATGMERQINIQGWLYRKDIFDKNNIKVPETMDELYTACKQLKKIYPNSYPFCIRSILSRINLIGSSWKPYFCYNAYYDYNADKWCYGAGEDTMYEIVSFLRKMYDEGLVAPDYANISTNSWQELITTDRGFIFPDYQTRIDFFNPIARKNNPEFTLTAMKPPKANTPTGTHLTGKDNYDPQGFSVCNTGKQASIINAFRYVDWFYSDEGCEITSWGKEGVTYENTDKGRRYIVSGSDTPKTLYGFGTIGSYLRVDPTVADVMVSDEQSATTDLLLDSQVEYYNPLRWAKFSQEDNDKIADLSTSITTYAEENIVKFISGQKPLSDWESYKAGLSKLPVDELLKAYEEAYNKITKNTK